MGTRTPFAHLPGGAQQEIPTIRKIAVKKIRTSSDIKKEENPQELSISTNPAKSVSPPLVSPYQRQHRQPFTGFMLFVRKERGTIHAKYPDVSVEELQSIYQKHWSALGPEGQAVLHNQAREINLRLGTISPNSPPDVVKENEEDHARRIIQAAHSAPTPATVGPKPAPPTLIKPETEAGPVAAIPTERSTSFLPSKSTTIDRLETVATSLGLKRKMSSASSAATPTTAATGGPQSRQRPAPLPTTTPNGMTANKAIEMYYISLCQPAFPEAGEVPLTPLAPNVYLEQYNILEWQRSSAREAALRL